MSPRMQHSGKMCEQIVEVLVPYVAEQLVTRFAEHMVAFPVPWILTENVEVARFVSHWLSFKRICEQIVEAPAPQVAELCARCAEHFGCCAQCL